jgi:phage terminase large subunit GpA-like protein
MTLPPELRRAWRPADDITVSEWAERNRMLLGQSSAEPGPWRNIRTPYLVEIMDAYCDRHIDTIVVCKGSQLGVTEAMLNMTGYSIDQDPAPTMIVYPTIELGRSVSATRIQPMIEASSALRARLSGCADDFGLQEMRMVGMNLYVTGANSPASLASRPVCNVHFDEIDKFPTFAGKEADPISLGRERQKTFWNRKTTMISTPTLEDVGIMRELARCDEVRDYHVPCVHCGAVDVLKFVNIKWPEDIDKDDARYSVIVRESAYYKCEHCGGVIDDMQRHVMIRGGRYVARQKATRPRSVGFVVSSLYSPWLTWGDIASEFVKSKASREKLQNFVNSWLAEPWVQKIDTGSKSALASAIDANMPAAIVPDEAVAMTIGIDSQQRGYWWSAWAWTREREGWCVEYGFVDSPDQLSDLLFARTWTRQNGAIVRPWRACIDMAGGKQAGADIGITERTYRWLMANWRGRGVPVFGVRGSPRAMAGKLKFNRPMEKTPQGKPIPGGIVIADIDTDAAKDELFWRLQQTVAGDSGGLHLHAQTDDVLIKHFTAEEKRRQRNGAEEWVQIRRDNHLLDTAVYALAAAWPEFHGGVARIAEIKIPAVSTARVDKVRENPWTAGTGNIFGG